MICHRSWTYKNTTPSLAIYDDRMVFQNPGSFPIGMKWQDFLGDEIGSLPANPIIANVFYRRGIMEAWGRGIGLIIRSCKEQELVEPEINVTQSFVNLTIWFKKTLNVNRTPSYTPSYTPSRTSSRTPNQEEIEDNISLLSPQERVFKFCEEAKSITEISRMLGVNDKKWVRKKYLAPYLGTVIQLTIPDKPNSRNQKYVIIKKSM